MAAAECKVKQMRQPVLEVDLGEGYAYHFSMTGQAECPSLDGEDQQILDVIIDRLGKMKKEEIVEFMHREEAYGKTALREIISFEYAEKLQI